MSDPGIDPQRLAALLDGQLSERERSELLAQLAASDEATEVYADAVAIVRELEGEVGDAAVARPLAPARGRPWWSAGRVGWLALAAALLLAVAVPWLASRSRSGGMDDPGRFVALLDESPARVELGTPPWSVTRGAGEPLAPETRAARIGARITDLELAVRGRDTSVATIAADLAALLDELPAGAPVAAIYRDVGARAERPPSALEPELERGRAEAARLAGEEMVSLGAWAEAARIAAARRDERFFRSRATSEMLGHAERLRDGYRSAREAAARLRAVISRGGAIDWTAIEGAVAELVREFTE